MIELDYIELQRYNYIYEPNPGLLVFAQGKNLVRPKQQPQGSWLQFLWHAWRLLQLRMSVVQQVRGRGHGTVDGRRRTSYAHPA